MSKLIKYKITFKYNEPEYILARDKKEALHNWKEYNAGAISLSGKGCDKIVSCEKYKEYTDAEWETHLDEVHQGRCYSLLSMPDCYKEIDNGDIIYIGSNKCSYGKVMLNRHRRK